MTPVVRLLALYQSTTCRQKPWRTARPPCPTYVAVLAIAEIEPDAAPPRRLTSGNNGHCRRRCCSVPGIEMRDHIARLEQLEDFGIGETF